jgi:hypothetical protein
MTTEAETKKPDWYIPHIKITDIEDIVHSFEYALAQKTLPLRTAAALQRLRDLAER